MEERKIIIVEDDFIIQDELKVTLEEIGYHVVETASVADEAIEKAEIHRPDLILMDIHLDGYTDGIEAAASIRERFDIPVIFITAYTDEDRIERAKLTHPYGYLVKPIQERDLRITIEMALYSAHSDRERRKAEKEVEKQKDFLRSVLESLTYPFYVIDIRDFSVVMANKAASVEESLDKPCYTLFHGMSQPCDSNDCKCPLEEVLNKKEHVTLEHVHYDRSGNPLYVEVHGIPIFDETGNVVQMIEYWVDITQRRKMENRLISAKQEAESASRAKSEFLANMSHELRTPLNGIIGFSQVLEKQLQNNLTEKQADYFKIVQESGQHLLEMVNDILDLSKIESGKNEMESEVFDFGKLLENAPLIVQSTAHKKNLLIKVEIEPDLGWLKGDETRLKQAVYNLFSNAVKFTEPGKSIGIDATVEDERFIVTVWDEGIGIPADELDKIFEPFEQASGKKKSSEKGTGLGLAITKRLIELHQGTLSVTSEVGKGSRFTMALPGRISGKEFEENHPRNQGIPVEPPRQKTQKILVVEDNESNRTLIEAVLEGYELTMIDNGEGAVKLASENDFDLILMDIQLPEMDGVQTMKQIRAERGNASPIVALTAFAMKGDKEKYLADGFDDYISKPLNVEKLQSKINDLLS